jgi:hypothetical protein
MAVLGVGGKLVLRREAPNPIAVSPDSVHVASGSLIVDDQNIWTGDLVTLTAVRGVPFLDANDVPQCPDGSASYFGSDWYLASNRSHIGSLTANFYQANNSANFYAQTPIATSASYYVYRDQLDRLSFYANQAESLQGDPTKRAPLAQVDWGTMSITPSSSTEWRVVGNIEGWNLDLNATSVDVTAVGEKFGESIKSLVTGGGGIDFLVDRKAWATGQTDATMLMQLLTMTEKGCLAEAEFWLVNRPNQEAGILAGELYYYAQLLVTNVAINLRPADLVAGTANFVTTGAIALRQGTN